VPASATPPDSPLPPDAAWAIVFGGTFDPPHLAHTRLVPRVRDQALPEAWLVYVPAARSPHKQDAPLAPDVHRVAMLHGALAGVPRAVVWTDELKRSGASYTIDTLERLRAACPRTSLRLLIGADQAAAFHRWRRAHEILQLAPPLVMPRTPLGDRASLMRALREAGAWSNAELRVWDACIAPCGVMDASATELRQLLGRTPRDRAALERLLDQGVLAYIEAHGLYA